MKKFNLALPQAHFQLGLCLGYLLGPKANVDLNPS